MPGRARTSTSRPKVSASPGFSPARTVRASASATSLAGDAGPEVGVVVVLVEDGQAVAQADVVGHVARLVAEGPPALLDVPEVHGIAVGDRQSPVGLLQPRVDGREHRVAGVLEDEGIAVGAEAPGIGHRLLVHGAVGRVAVDEEERVPAPQDVADEAAHLGALELHAVAVEVEVLAVVTDARALLGAVLAHAVAGVHLVVAVGVEDGGDEQDDLVEVGPFGVEEDVPGQHERGLLALDLSGVDIGLDVDDDAVVVAEEERIVRQRVADDQERDGPAFGRDGQGLDPDERRELLEVADEGQDVGVGRGRGVARRLGRRARARSRGRGRPDHLGRVDLGGPGRPARRLGGGGYGQGERQGDEGGQSGQRAGRRCHGDLRLLRRRAGQFIPGKTGTQGLFPFLPTFC
ncbi:MAG: hypothetical protein MUE80_05505 [Acidobacteria bacterium]|nr:hypothetical protein [Acidobacteriota bacterium]